MSLFKTPPPPPAAPTPVEPAGLSELDQARADVAAATAALEAGRTAHEAAHAAVAEVVGKAAALDPDVTGADLTAGHGELDLAARRMPALQQRLTDAQLGLQRAEGEVLLREFEAWHDGGRDAILAKAEAARTALQDLIAEVSDFNTFLHGVRRRLEVTHDPLSRMVLDGNGRLRLDGKPISYATGVEWVCRLAGEAMQGLPTGEGARLGGDLLAEGRVVSPAPVEERPDDGTAWRPVQPNLPPWMSASMAAGR